MARPVPRRRASTDAPAADEYTSRRGRKAAEEEPEDDSPVEERRPRRGRERGELPARGGRRAAAAEPEEEPTPSRRGRRAAAEEEPAPSRRGRRPAPEPDTTGADELPKSLRAVRALEDDEFSDLVELLELEDDATEEDVWEAIQEAQEPEEEPEPAPRGRRGRRAEPEEKPARRGRGRAAARDDDDEDDGDDDGGSTGARRGFAGFKKTRETTSSFDDFKLTDEEVLVKFLEDEPYAAYAEHGLYQELREGQRVWNCLESKPKPVDCDICATGHNARAVGLFNVVAMPEEGKPKLVTLKAGPALMTILEQKAKLKTGPLSKEYYSMSQSPGKNDGPVVYSVDVVRERDVVDPDGWDMDALSEDELDDFRDQMKDENDVKYPSAKDVKAVARKLRDRD